MALGPFQEALGAMFALINEMEMAIRINTLIIFGNSARLHEGEAELLKSWAVSSNERWEGNVGSLMKKHTRNMKGWWERYPSWQGASGDFFSFTLAWLPLRVIERRFPLPFIRREPLLDVAYNMKYFCGNIITVQIYWQWQRGIRASLCVPQDERVFLWLAPEALWSASGAARRQWRRLNNVLSVRNNEKWLDPAWGKDETPVRGKWGRSFVTEVCQISHHPFGRHAQGYIYFH